jgi:putative ABC transport system permease protein
MSTLIQSLQHSFRTLVRNPGFTSVAVLVLSLSIGTSATIFSVVDAVLLRPLPYKEPGQLVRVTMSRPDRGINAVPVSAPDLDDFRGQNKVFNDMAVYYGWTSVLTGGQEPEYLKGLSISANFFSLLGVSLAMGRPFLQEECAVGRDRVVIFSHGFWQRRFGSDPDILGKTVTLNRNAYTVVGVTSQGFTFPGDAEIWKPVALDPNEMNRGRRFLNLLARLKPGAQLRQAQTEARIISARLQRQYPDSNAGWEAQVITLQEQIVGKARPLLLILLGAVGFVLLIACASLAVLLFAHALKRQKEIAVRSAMGASRSHIVRQMLTESLMLSLTGGALGLGLSLFGTKIFLALAPPGIPRLDGVQVNLTVVCFALMVAVLTGVAFSLIPALLFSGLDLSGALKEHWVRGQGQSSNIYHQRVRNSLVVTEIAMAVILLAGAGAMIKSLWLLQKSDLGFNPDNVLVMDVMLSSYRYPSPKHREQFFDLLIESVKGLPKVRSVATTEFTPLSGASFNTTFSIEGRAESGSGEEFRTSGCVVSPDYFETMGIQILRGRQFAEQDEKMSSESIIINETMARRYWPDEDPVGHHIKLKKSEDKLWEIVGVVGDVKQFSIETEPLPYVYVPYGRLPDSGKILVVRTDDDPVDMMPALRSQVWAIDKDAPILKMNTMEQAISASLAQPRFNTFILSIFSALGFILAVVSLYGVVAYTVSQRTREIGIRMALGAGALDVMKLVIKQGIILTLAGIAIGLACVFALMRVLSNLIYGLSATDPTTLAAASLAMAAVALAASIVPARRAMKVDPVAAIRHE